MAERLPYHGFLRMVPRRMLCLLLAALLCALWANPAGAARHLLLQPAASLSEAPAEAPQESRTFKKERREEREGRSRSVRIHEDFRGFGAIAEGDRIVLDLFDDLRLEAIVDRISVNSRGSRTVRARVDGKAFSHILIVTKGNRTAVSVNIPEHRSSYRITCGEDGAACRLADTREERRHHLPPRALPIPRRMEAPPDGKSPRSLAAPLAEPLAQGEPLLSENSNAGDEGSGVDDPATIDVMVVYTPAAFEWAETDERGGIDNIIAQAMGHAQLVADNSNTGVTFRLVHSTEVIYTESGVSSTDLNRLTDGVGAFSDVHQWRDLHGADLVVLLTDATDVGGLGWLLENPEGEADHGFSLTRVSQADSYTMVHELGHNMGLHHHRQQNIQPGPGLFDYSAGWRWTGTDNGHYCSVMTYEKGRYFQDWTDHIQVPHFSNPSVLFAGEATGHEIDGDNARTVREIKHVVAAYRIREIIRGDLNNDRTVDLADLVIALQVVAGMDPGAINSEAVLGEAGRVGLADGIYILRHVANLSGD